MEVETEKEQGFMKNKRIYEGRKAKLDIVVIFQLLDVSCEIITDNMIWYIHQTLSVISGTLYVFCILPQHHKYYLSQDTGFIVFGFVWFGFFSLFFSFSVVIK